MQFLYDNLIDSATLTASSAATGFPAANLVNPFRTKVWRTAGATAGTANLVINNTSTWSTTGASLATNGTFDDNATGWTAVDCTLASSHPAGGGQSDDYLIITRTGGSSQDAYQVISGLTSGTLYKLVVYVKQGSVAGSSAVLQVTSADGINEWAVTTQNSTASWATIIVYFTATATSCRIILRKNSADAGTIFFDTVTLYAMTGAEVNIIALTGYNWASAPGTLNIEFNNADSWGAPADTESLTWAASTSANGNKATIIKKLAANHNYLYARLNVVYSPGGVATDWDLGRMFLGAYFEPTYTYDAHPIIDLVDDSIMNQTIGGQRHFDEIEKFRRVSFSCTAIDQAQWELYQEMINAVGTSDPIFIAFDYDNEPDEMTIYGHFMRLPRASGFAYAAYKMNFEFEESR